MKKIFYALILVFCWAPYCFGADDPMLDVRIPMKYPSDELLQFLKGEASAKDAGFVAVDTGNPLFDGVSNSFYRHTADMPLTRFVLGTLNFDLSGLTFQVANPDATRGAFGGAGQGALMSKSDPLFTTFKTDDAQKALNGAGGAFDLVMQKIPVVLLAGFFSIQLFIYMMLYVFGEHTRLRVPDPSFMIIRLLFFFLILWYFKIAMASIITYSNYASNVIMPYAVQEQFIDTIVLKTFGIPGDGATLGDLVAYAFRFLGYLSIKILIILRDVLMSLSLLLGPFCFAVGYISMSGWGGDVFASYLSGWTQNFIKILFWGPFAAMMIYAMGIIAVITGMTQLDGYTAAIFGLACLFAAKDVPGLAEKFSGLAMTSLVGKILPAIGGVAAFGGSVASGGTVAVLGGLHAATKKARAMSSVASGSKPGKSLSSSAAAASAGVGATPNLPGPNLNKSKDGKYAFDPKNGVLLDGSGSISESDRLTLHDYRRLYKIPSDKTSLEDIGKVVADRNRNRNDLMIYVDKEGRLDYGWKGDAEVKNAVHKFKASLLVGKDDTAGQNMFKNMHLSHLLPLLTTQIYNLDEKDKTDFINSLNSTDKITSTLTGDIMNSFRRSLVEASLTSKRLEQELEKQRIEGQKSSQNGG